MSYVSLYRRWRPQTFADIVGQDHVVGTLQNALRTGQVHHALLFSGTRGTGKTSTARVLAKALNCERGPAPEPCNECASCLAITAGSSLDVVEIDAASHGSVEDARDLREKAGYAPASSRYKVYIVDEAHMVTTQGFNAMLKVLEEPPEHVRFIFATTEPHKVIEAIRSRCQQHDFRRIRTAVLVEHFSKICAAEGIDIDTAALELIARIADGSDRDGLSRLDQVLTLAGRHVTLADVVGALGVLPAELRFDLAEAFAAHRVAEVFGLVERVVDAGHDLTQFARDALQHVRDLFVLRLAPDSTTLVDVTPETRARLLGQSSRFGPGELARMLRILGEVVTDLRTATDQRLVLEVGFARAAVPEASPEADALLARIERLERRLQIGIAGGGQLTGPREGVEEVAQPTVTAPAMDPPAVGARRPEPVPAAAAPDPEPVVPAPKPAEAVPTAGGAVGVDLVRRSWPLVHERVQRRSRVIAAYLQEGSVAAVEGQTVVLEFPAATAKFYAEALARDGRIEQVEAALDEVLGGTLRIRLVLQDNPAETAAIAEAPPGATELPREDPPGLPGEVDGGGADPEQDRDGGRLGADADVRAVADWAVRELDAEVIEQRPTRRRGSGRQRG